MSKVTGSYKSVVLGVSQQLPQDRLEGQHGEQVNMVADPVRGLVRRNGMVLDDAVWAPLGSATVAGTQEDSYSFRTLSYRAGDRDYDVLYRTRAAITGTILPGLGVYDKTGDGVGGYRGPITDPTDTAIVDYAAGGYSAATAIGAFVLLAGNTELPAYTAVNRWTDPDNVALSVAWVRGGAYSRTYTVTARDATSTTEYTVSYTTKSAVYDGDIVVDDVLPEVPDATNNSNIQINSITTFTAPATDVVLAITTAFLSDGHLDATSAVGTKNIKRIYRYDEMLQRIVPEQYLDVTVKSVTTNTSMTVDILRVAGGPWSIDNALFRAAYYAHTPNPNYQTELNDRTSAYNEAVNQWTREAAEDIVPSNIAEQLRLLLIAAGFTGWERSVSHIGNPNCDLLKVDDGGSDDLIVALAQRTLAADEVTDRHYPGKVVLVSPNGRDEEGYYLEAVAEDPDLDPTDLQEVIWRETAGTAQTPDNIFAIATMYEGNLYLASTPAKLATLIFDETGDTVPTPTFIASNAGDEVSAPPPYFYGRRINCMFVFQDRLCICADSTVTMSKVGEYTNFYRSTMLTLPADDPIEGYALGSEGDTIRKAAVYDRNLILFGDKYIYTVSGRTVQTPSEFSMAVQLSIDNTSHAQPVGLGQNLFFLKEDGQLASSRLMQVQAGLFQDSPTVDDCSKPLRDYINGTPAEIVALSNPAAIFVRTEFFLKSAGAFGKSRPWGIYLYQFLDNAQGERLQFSWGAWEWSSTLGTPIGMSADIGGDAIRLYTIAFTNDADGLASGGILAMSCSARPDPTGLPYLDCMIPAVEAEDDPLLGTHAGETIDAVRFTAFGAQGSYDEIPSSLDADRFGEIEDADYTVGDKPAQEVDPNRWAGVQGGYSQALAAYPELLPTNTWTGVAYPAYVDLTNPQVRDRDGNARTLGRLTLTKLRLTLTRTAGVRAVWRDRTSQKESFIQEDGYIRKQYVNVWVGRDVNNVQVRIEALKWLPLTISAIEFQGQWFAPRGRA